MAERISVSIPQETVNDESVRILVWHSQSGARVELDQLLCEAETSKAVMEIRSPAAGILVYSAGAGEEVPVGATICEIVPEGLKPVPVPDGATARESARGPRSYDSDPPRFTPLALKIAAEYGIDLSSFAPGTLVRRNDVLKKAGHVPVERIPQVPVAVARENRPPDPGMRRSTQPVAGVPVEWTDLPRRKLIEGAILAGGAAGAIASSVTRVCPAPKLRSRAERLTFPTVGLQALVVFEVARLLRRYPVFNAVHDGKRIGTYGQVNVGWAIDGGGKLVVPVIPRADEKSVSEIAAIMSDQLEGYLTDSLPAGAFAGGTFVVTDLSSDGVSFFQPLISQGQSAILGIGSDRGRQAGETFHLTLAFDHQLGEGRTAATFLAELADRLEAHSRLAEVAASGRPESSELELFCALCQRDAVALRGIKAILLRSEMPAGFVCSLCVGGWL